MSVSVAVAVCPPGPVASRVLGEEEFRLGTGEAAEFDTRVPHWIGSAGDRPAEVLALFGAQGERAHPAPAGPGTPAVR